VKPVLVINLVGLTRELLGEHTPHLSKLAKQGAALPIQAVLPAVTCTAQATFLTGKPPSEHGIVANGWYFTDLSEVMFWKQSNRLVHGEKVWDVAKRRDPSFTVANLFWWYNMYSTVDWAVTPRPMYPADGRKLPDVHTQPLDLRAELSQRLGTFPLFKFWGPAADIESSRWITEAALHVMKTRNPSLQFVYLPHLDYNLQRLGPDLANPVLQQDLRAVDALVGELVQAAEQQQRRVLVVSEYGITKVDDAVHINRALRGAGWIAIRDELGRELLDAGASDAFAVADHQLAHVYVKQKQLIPEVRAVLSKLDGVEVVYDKSEQARLGIAHERSGDLVAVSHANRWFSYYYWLDSARAPDFATTVDIHRKPGYDPVELFLDPKLTWPKLSIAWRLLKKAAGFRMLMDVISSEATKIVKGSHGRPTENPDQGPLLISDRVTSALEPFLNGGSVPSASVFDLILAALFEPDKSE
jgi:predicted AlkP superfamily pyrophosphatase or phosphodiesterase